MNKIINVRDRYKFIESHMATRKNGSLDIEGVSISGKFIVTGTGQVLSELKKAHAAGGEEWRKLCDRLGSEHGIQRNHPPCPPPVSSDDQDNPETDMPGLWLNDSETDTQEQNLLSALPFRETDPAC